MRNCCALEDQINSSYLNSMYEARVLLKRAKEAQNVLATFSQKKIDYIVESMANAGFKAAQRLAEMAVEETGFGKVADKITKNIIATRELHEYIKDMVTCGEIYRSKNGKFIKIATPMGIVVGLIPSTNPTSTLLYKALIAIKSRNALVVSPHPKAVKCICEAANIMQEAATKAGAPEHIIASLSRSTREGKRELIKHPLADVILATGNCSIVKEAHSSGKPAYGVGPGNVPVIIEKSANISKAVADIITGKTFDNGTICASEQSVICERQIHETVIDEFKQRNAYFVNQEEQRLLENYMFPQCCINSEIVGKSPQFIAKRAGFKIPEDTTVIIAILKGVGEKYPLSAEKLSPVLSFYIEDGIQGLRKRAFEVLQYGGLGHTMVIHSSNQEAILSILAQKPAFRILINTPSSFGAIGVTTMLAPAFTLATGTLGGSITTDNITPKHLLNIKRVVYETVPINDENGKRIR